jgi:outer membrane protein W
VFLLKGRHAISLTGGMKTNSKTVAVVDPMGIDLESGFVGSIGYGYWFDENWQVNFSIGVFGAKTQVDYNGVSTGTTIPVLIGFAYYPMQLAMGTVGRPYVGLAGGMYSGTATQTGLAGVGTVTEIVPGGKFTIGIDFRVGDWLKLGPSVSYHRLGAFSKIVGEEADFSGVELSVGMGVLL